MAGRADPGRPVDVQPDVALGRGPRFAGVEAHPVAHRDPAGPLVGGQGELAVDGRLDRLPGGREDEVQAVAGRTALERPETGERVTDEPVVIGQDLG